MKARLASRSTTRQSRHWMCQLVLCAVACATHSPAYGDNEEGSLAIHVVASNEYLECPDLCPPDMSCLDVDCDLSLAELEASGGYGYAVFLAYNVDEVQAIEFLVVGWPIGPGTPDFLGPYYCAGDDASVWGEPFEKRGGVGGQLSFPCEEPCTGMFCFCTIAFGPSIYDWLPIVIEYGQSSLSYPADPHNFFHNCTDWAGDWVVYEHSAVIGGECEPIPNCMPGPSDTESGTWSTIKNLYR
jgi:hypothetical protein